MEQITALIEIDYADIFVSIFAIFIGAVTILSVYDGTIGRLLRKLNIETKQMRQRREERELLIKTSQNLTELQERYEEDMKRSDSRDERISNDVERLTQMFIDSRIDDMRWEINNFATKVSDGKPCNKDSFKHCIHMYEKYEKILEENGLENGEVEISMELINDTYKEKLKEGF